MSRRPVVSGIAVLVCTAWLGVAAATAAPSAAEQAFHHGYYLQSHEQNYAQAADAFRQVLAQESLPPQLRQQAERRLEECEEEAAAADLATLMPPDAIGYAEISRPGRHIGQVLQMLGLVREGGLATLPGSARIPIEGSFGFPTDFAVSPALVRELEKFRGIAVAVVDIHPDRIPDGLVVVHPGESDLLRGLLETAVQVLPPTEPIEGYTTYRVQEEGVDVWLTQTARLFLVSASRDQLVAAVARLKNPGKTRSLATDDFFAAQRKDREEALLFASVNVSRLAPLLEQMMRAELRGEEFLLANSMLNLRQIESAAIRLGASQGGIQADATIRFKPDHQHLLYGLVRTAPISPDSLRLIPKNAGGVLMVGLNPPNDDAGRAAELDAARISVMDIGRELFGNLQDVSAFVMPGGQEFPEVGLVFRAQQSEKSEALWNQLLGLPAQLGLLPREAARDTEIRGQAAKQYLFPEAPPIVVVRHGDRTLLVGTAAAVEASLEAAESGGSLANSRQLKPLIDELTPHSSKAALVHAGPLMDTVASMVPPHDRDDIAVFQPIMKDLVAGVTVDEAPAEFRVTLRVAGLPKAAEVIQLAARELQPRRAPAADVRRYDRLRSSRPRTAFPEASPADSAQAVEEAQASDAGDKSGSAPSERP